MRFPTLNTVDFPGGIRRSGIALVILAGHVALLYAATVLRPNETPRALAGPVTAHFIEQSEPRREWEPPSVAPQTPPLEMSVPTAPAIELSLEKSTESRAPTVRATPAKTPPSPSSTAPRLISTVEYVREPSPRYPPQSRRLREQGLVVLRVLIDENGQARDIEVESSSGHERLDRAAKEAVARAAFRPYVENGAARRALVLIPIEFSLASGTV
jgi:protein TonB